MNAATSPGWARSLVDTLLPVGVNADQPVRLDCDDAAIGDAARVLGIARDDAIGTLVASLKEEGLVSEKNGVTALAVETGDPPLYVIGLALLVLAASRMATDERGSMREYYKRLADALAIPMRDRWPHVEGVPELIERFDDLADWMEHAQAGARGLLDLPDAVYPAKVGIPINQSLIRAGDRATLGAFFERTYRLIDAGWDPVHQLRGWGGRHGLSVPLLELIDTTAQHPALAGALRAARRAWDGSTVDADGRRVLPCQLTLHLPPPGALTISATVPALAVDVDAIVHGTAIRLGPMTPAEVPLDWLHAAGSGPLIAHVGEERVRILPGDTILFEITDAGIESVPAATSEPVWALTCDPGLISRCPSTRRYRADLPTGWVLLSDVEPELLAEGLRTLEDQAERPLAGVNTVGGLRLGREVWLLDYPPQITSDLPEPAPIAVDGRYSGYLEPNEPLELEELASLAGLHKVEVGEQDLIVELVEEGQRQGIGTIGFDLDPHRVHGGAGKLDELTERRLTGARVTPASPAGERPLIVRYRCTVEVIDVDGTARQFGPPSPAPWLEEVGLPDSGPWPITLPSRVVWLCVDAAAGRFVVAHQAVDVPLNDEVIDIVEWFENAEVVDRSGGGADVRWRRLTAALETAT